MSGQPEKAPMLDKSYIRKKNLPVRNFPLSPALIPEVDRMEKISLSLMPGPNQRSGIEIEDQGEGQIRLKSLFNSG